MSNHVPQFHAPIPSTNVFKDDIFKGKVAFVTGGGSGICKGQTEALVRHGAKAVIVGRTQSKLDNAAKDIMQKTGGEVVGYSADVRKLDQLEAAVKKTLEKFGKIDFVICGAAGNFLAPISGLSSNAFKTVMDIDLLGTFNTFKATVEPLKETHGNIVIVSATLYYTAFPYQAHASAAKAGVDALMQVAAAEYGPYGVRMNCIAPGGVNGTEGHQRLIPEAVIEENRKRTPIQRYGTVDDTANLTIFLFSDASSWIHGAKIVIDGGAWFLTGTMPYPLAVLDPQAAMEQMSKL